MISLYTFNLSEFNKNNNNKIKNKNFNFKLDLLMLITETTALLVFKIGKSGK